MHWITKAASACLLALYMLVGVVVPSSTAQTTEPLSCDIGVLVGTSCVLEGPLPTEGGLTCPVSATVFESPDGECYSIVGGAVLLDDCAVPYVAAGVVCKVTNTGTTTAEVVSFSCPTAPVTPTENMHTTSGVTKIESCTYLPGSVESCPAFTSADPDGGCRRPAPLSSGLVCVAPFELIDARCLLITSAVGTSTSPTTAGLGIPLAPISVPAVTGTFAGGALACSATAAEVTIVVPPIVNVWTNRDLDVSVDIGGNVVFSDQLAADRTIVIAVTPAMAGEQTVSFSSTLLNGAGYTVSCSEPLTIP